MDCFLAERRQTVPDLKLYPIARSCQRNHRRLYLSLPLEDPFTHLGFEVVHRYWRDVCGNGTPSWLRPEFCPFAGTDFKDLPQGPAVVHYYAVAPCLLGTPHSKLAVE